MATLGRLDPSPPASLEDGTQKLNVFNHALQTVLNAVGGPLPGPPANGFRGEMPDQITMIDDEALGNLLNNLSQWCGFLEVEYAKARTQRDQASAMLDFVKARVRIGLKTDPETGRKMTVSDKNDLVETDERVIDATSQMLYIETVYSLTKVLYDKAQRDWETASRRITQRGQSIDRGRRENSVGGFQPGQGRSPFRRPSSMGTTGDQR
jgi:hypothetical protein